MLIDDEARPDTRPRPMPQDRIAEVRAILIPLGWHQCRVALWLGAKRPGKMSRLDAVNAGGAEFEAVLAEARAIAGRR